jgi:hypothetical protein
MTRKEPLQVATAVALAISLVACGDSGASRFGGGGTGGVGTVSTGTGKGTTGGTTGSGSSGNPYDWQAGVANMIAQGLTVNVTFGGSVNTGTSSQATITGSGVYTLSRGVTATFNGASAVSQLQTLSGTATAAGQNVPASRSVTAYYATSTIDFLGQVSSTEYDVAQAPFQYLTSIQGGMTGTLGTAQRYTDSTMSVSLGSAVTSYSTTAPSTPGGPISIQVQTDFYDKNDFIVESDSTTYSLTSGNVMSFVSAYITTEVSTPQGYLLTMTPQ